MATHVLQDETGKVYFCTITCFKWLSLFELANYDAVYSWFNYLENKDQCKILGYVIMPNHLHVLLYYNNPQRSVNKIIGEGKRFMAYAIVKQLKKMDVTNIIATLKNGVSPLESRNGKLHNVFQHHSDIKLCYSKNIIEQKLDDIHRNPVTGKWNLSENFVEYIHSSASFYELGEQKIFPVTHYLNI
ncbi:MAG: transposase [Candidatus Cyclobacteriaceae bacterium M2_1C_046]